MRQGLQSASTRWPVAAVLAVLALLAGAVDAGAHTPATAALGGLPRAGGLDYSPTPAGRLTPLSPAFVAQSLGLDVSALGGPSGSSAGDAGAAATSSNVVHSQTLPCVNGHQTADPLSPPCVASFSGDNGGATYHGVSRDEVRVVLRLVGGLKPRSGPLLNYAAPTETLVDLNQPPAPNEHFLVTKARLLKTYFNRHFQFYGRHLHLFVYFDGDSNQIREPDNPEHMRKLALEVLWRVNPFAVVQYDPDTTDDAGAFLDTLARAGVVGFDSVNLLPGGRFDRVSDRLWGYLPSAEQMADLFATYVCEKVVGKPVAMSGNPRDNGRPRRLGLLYPGDTRPVVYQLLTQAVRERLAACGAQVVAEAPLTPTSECGASFGLFGFPENAAEEALTVVRRFRHAGVTTVLWLGCNDHNIPVTARAEGYLPEWILLGDGNRDETHSVSSDDAGPSFDRHAIAVTWQPAPESFLRAHCYAAQRESDPTLPASPPTTPGPVAYEYNATFLPATFPPFETAGDAEYGCGLYSALLQVAGSLQGAGPNLTGGSLAAGLHALHQLASPDPQTPTCFYGSGHSCVRDGAAWYWDNLTTCFRAIEDGRRYTADRWPPGNINAQITGREPCASMR